MFSKNKGFTLIELLIVIAILAVLASVTIIAINPVEIFKRTRDSQRISDLDSIRTAINYYVVNTSSPVLGSTSNSYSHVASTNCGGRTGTTGTQAVNGTGWIPVNLTSLGGTAPLSKWPIDPNFSTVNGNPSRYYVYLTNSASSTFEVIANMESSQYSEGGSNDVESKDGGKISSLYEIGTEFIISSTNANCFPYPDISSQPSPTPSLTPTIPICFLAGTKITMADGTYKNTEDIKIGDLVKSYNFDEKKIETTKVTKINIHLPEEMGYDYYLIINNKLKATPNHPLDKPDGKVITVGELKIGDLLQGENGVIEVFSIEKVYQKVTTYSLETESGSYFIDGISDVGKQN